MKEPKVTRIGAHNSWQMPDREWLEDQYWTRDKSTKQIASEIGANSSTVQVWCNEMMIPFRTRSENQARRTGNRANHTKGGIYRSTQRAECERSGKPCVCSWCGMTGKYRSGKTDTAPLVCSLQLHHKDHDKGNVTLDNLVYLCPKCHRLETALWHIRKSKKAKVTVVNKIITIDFNV